MDKLVLNGYLSRSFRDDGYVSHPGPVQSLFTPGERQTALEIAAKWEAKGWKPILLDGKKVLYHYKQRQVA